MMSIIGWATLIYMTIGCLFTIAYYAVLSYHDEFESFLSNGYDSTVPNSIKKNVSERSFASLITVGFIFNWLIISLVFIYLVIMDKITKDEA